MFFFVTLFIVDYICTWCHSMYLHWEGTKTSFNEAGKYSYKTFQIFVASTLIFLWRIKTELSLCNSS